MNKEQRIELWTRRYKKACADYIKSQDGSLAEIRALEAMDKGYEKLLDLGVSV